MSPVQPVLFPSFCFATRGSRCGEVLGSFVELMLLVVLRKPNISYKESLCKAAWVASLPDPFSGARAHGIGIPSLW